MLDGVNFVFVFDTCIILGEAFPCETGGGKGRNFPCVGCFFKKCFGMGAFVLCGCPTDLLFEIRDFKRGGVGGSTGIESIDEFESGLGNPWLPVSGGNFWVSNGGSRDDDSGERFVEIVKCRRGPREVVVITTCVLEVERDV